MIETEVAIVFATITELGPDITNINTIERMVVFKAAYLSNERLHSVVIFIDDQSCKHNGMGCSDTKSTWPELGRLD